MDGAWQIKIMESLHLTSVKQRINTHVQILLLKAYSTSKTIDNPHGSTTPGNVCSVRYPHVAYSIGM